MKKSLVLVMVLILSQLSFASMEPARAGSTWYVSPSGSGTLCTQASPCEIGSCVQTKAAWGDTILAKEGTYKANDPSSQYLLYIYKSLTIIGSCKFEATGPVSCDMSRMTSILDGETDRRVIAVQGIAGNGLNVYIGGFYIMRGNANGMGPANCMSGYAGTAQDCGGGIYSENVDQLILQHNYIWANTASDSTDPDDVSLGGGLYVDNSKYVMLSDNTIIFNNAANQGYGHGGGMFISNSGKPGGILLMNNTFYNNEIGQNRIGTGAGLLSFNNSDLHLLQNKFEYQNFFQKKLLPGSAIMLRGATGVTLTQNKFTQNEGSSTISIIGDMGSITGVMEQNKFWYNPSAIMIEIFGDVTMRMVNNFFGRVPEFTRSNNTLLDLKGSEVLGTPYLDILHNTFVGAGYGIKAHEHTSINVNRNIFVSFSERAIEITSPATTTYTINENLFNWNTHNGYSGTNSYSGNPHFVDISNGDLHIMTGSAAIDKVSGGSLFMDIDSQLRPIGIAPVNFDVGADEYMVQIFMPIIFN